MPLFEVHGAVGRTAEMAVVVHLGKLVPKAEHAIWSPPSFSSIVARSPILSGSRLSANAGELPRPGIWSPVPSGTDSHLWTRDALMHNGDQFKQEELMVGVKPKGWDILK